MVIYGFEFEVNPDHINKRLLSFLYNANRFMRTHPPAPKVIGFIVRFIHYNQAHMEALNEEATNQFERFFDTSESSLVFLKLDQAVRKAHVVNDLVREKTVQLEAIIRVLKSKFKKS